MNTREVVEEETAVAGVKRERVLSLVDRLHRQKAITFDQYAAAGILRNIIMAGAPPSLGVSSYGDDAGRGDGPAHKADRLGRRLTGYEIDYEGHVYYRGGRHWNAEQHKLEDALFAAVGVFDDAGNRRVDRKHAEILIRIVTETENQPRLGDITRELTSFYGANSRRVQAYALGTIVGWLGRLSLHFRLTK